MCYDHLVKEIHKDLMTKNSEAANEKLTALLEEQNNIRKKLEEGELDEIIRQ